MAFKPIILANYGTKERILVFVDLNETNIQKTINERFGGNWVKIDKPCLGNVVKFTSEDVYLGFDNRKDNNYCQGALIK